MVLLPLVDMLQHRSGVDRVGARGKIQIGEGFGLPPFDGLVGGIVALTW